MGNKKPKRKNTIVFPNEYARNDIIRKFGTNRTFPILYLTISRRRDKELHSRFTMAEFLEMYCVALDKNRKPLTFYRIIEAIKFMENKNMIVVHTDLNDIKYHSMIDVEIVPENFDPQKSYFRVSCVILDMIMESKTKIDKGNILAVYLYIKSYIRSEEEKSTEIKIPSAFFGSVNKLIKDTGLGKEAVNKCLNFLISDDNEWHCPVFVKGKLNMSKDENGNKVVPNIYVENSDYAYWEIKAAQEYMDDRNKKKK